MSDEVVLHMISFIEEKERQAQAEQFLTETQVKNDVVKAILNKLDCEVSDANS